MQKKKKCVENKRFTESKNLLASKNLTGRKDGITLIALVVTIIILLILAGVALTAMINGGIFDKSKVAAEQTQIGKEKEQIATSYAKYKMESAQGIGTTITVDGASVTGNDEEGWTITFEDTGNTYKIHPDGKVEETGKVENPPLEPTVDPTDIYVTLYADGTLGFSNNTETILGKEVSKSYGNIKGQSFLEYNSLPWREERESITTVEFQNEIVPTVTESWFISCNNLREINNISNLNTCNVTSMKFMFNGCKNLTELNLQGLDTSNVVNMEGIFEFCSSLSKIDLSSFNTNSAENMGYMFGGCSSLTQIDLKSFRTNNATSMRGMFEDCKSLTNLDVSNFNTSKVRDMAFMFCNCNSLEKLDLKNFDTQNVTEMQWMFADCKSLTNLDVSNFNTSNVLYMNQMFSDCNNIEELDLSKFQTGKVTSMAWMFSSCDNLARLNVSNFDTSSVTDMSLMFDSCTNLEELDLSSFDTSNVTTMQWMFNGCRSLKELDLGSFDTSRVENMNRMFEGCSNLKVVYGRKDRWITTNVTDDSGMWSNCGTNHITYKTYLEGNKVVGYEITKGYGWRDNGATKVREGNNKRASCVHFIQLDPEKQYKIEMKNSNYDFGYVKVDIDLKTLFDSGWQSPDKSPIITDTEYILVNFSSHTSHETQITDEMLAEIEEAFSITVVE